MKRWNKHQRAGSIGGQTTLKKYGPDHFSRIGKTGARVTHERYSISKWGLFDYAMVDRATNKIVAFLGSRPGQAERDLPYEKNK